MQNSGYFSEKELNDLDVKFGKNVLISKKTSIYCRELEIGNNVRIDDFCVLTGQIKIGSYVHIASFCQLSGSSGIVIEDFAGVASRSLLFSQSDDFSGSYMTGPLINSKYTNVAKGTIFIGKHAVIGAGSIIMPKVKISEGTAVGSMSLVKEDTEPWTIYVGVPAKSIKERKQKILELEKEFLRKRGDL